MNRIAISAVALASFATSGRVALVFLPVLRNAAECRSELEGLSRVQTEISKLAVSVLAAVPYTKAIWRDSCPSTSPDVRLLFDPDRTIAGLYGTAGDRLGVLVDERGIVRRVVRGTQQFAKTLVADLKAWDDGKATYDAQCAR